MCVNYLGQFFYYYYLSLNDSSSLGRSSIHLSLRYLGDGLGEKFHKLIINSAIIKWDFIWLLYHLIVFSGNS
jgi:hypothetical protein